MGVLIGGRSLGISLERLGGGYPGAEFLSVVSSATTVGGARIIQSPSPPNVCNRNNSKWGITILVFSVVNWRFEPPKSLMFRSRIPHFREWLCS